MKLSPVEEFARELAAGRELRDASSFVGSSSPDVGSPARGVGGGQANHHVSSRKAQSENGDGDSNVRTRQTLLLRQMRDRGPLPSSD